MYKNKQQKHGIHISFAPSFLSIPDCAVGVYQSRLGLFNPIFFFFFGWANKIKIDQTNCCDFSA